jgi:hypothetical protein
MPEAELDFPMSDVSGVRQEHIGACQIDFSHSGMRPLALVTRAG